MQKLAGQIHTFLLKKKKTLAVAESCTGGLLSGLLTQRSGSSGFFLLGVVAYSNRAKRALLKVPAPILRKHGAVSSPVALALAKNVRSLAKADFGIGITGIAGPSGGTRDKPVGTVFIGAAGARGQLCRRFLFSGSRSQVRNKACIAALRLLCDLSAC